VGTRAEGRESEAIIPPSRRSSSKILPKGGIKVFKEISFKTQSREDIVDITDRVQEAIAESGIEEGFIFIYVPHTTAAVSIHARREGGEAPRLEVMLDTAYPEREASHTTKAAFVAPTEVGIIKDGRMLLGEDQRIFFYEFAGPAVRKVYLYIGS
jgi:secondary thiamine-phosphate synthase enzyme